MAAKRTPCGPVWAHRGSNAALSQAWVSSRRQDAPCTKFAVPTLTREAPGELGGELGLELGLVGPTRWSVDVGVGFRLET